MISETCGIWLMTSLPKVHAFCQSDSRFQLCDDIVRVMARPRRDVIDFQALEKELHGALEAERRYTRENDAKLRAVHQKVATYNEFR